MQQSLALNYLHALQQADYAALLALFTNDALVLSPLYGTCPAATFYKTLLEDTQQSELQLLDTFFDASGQKMALHFLYRWTLADGSIATFDCVDVFELNENGKIKQLKIIYDTVTTRPLLNQVKGGL